MQTRIDIYNNNNFDTRTTTGATVNVIGKNNTRIKNQESTVDGN